MKTHLKSFLVISSCFAGTAFANEQSGWYLEPTLGFSNLSGFTATANNTDGLDGPLEVDVDSGFSAGLGLGYRYNPKLSIELAWEYRSNDSSVVLPNGQAIEDGNYASNTFFLNGQYSLGDGIGWEPYVGGGLAWVQEIDIDVGGSENERSFSADGDVGFQVFAGVELPIADNLSLSGELRYLSFSALDLDSEAAGAGSISGLEYQPVTLQVGLQYRF